MKPNTSTINCPYCGSDKIIKKGKRENKHKSVQLYLCKECKKRFTNEAIKNKSYKIEDVIKTLSLYNQGFTIVEISKKTGIPKSTIGNWKNQYADLFNLQKYVKLIRDFSKKHQTINRYKYLHKLVYIYQQNSFKLETFIRNKEKRLYNYLKLLSYGKIDNNIFTKSTLSASKVKLNINHAVELRKTNNNACKLTRIALATVDDNYKRHAAVEKVMLKNDISTIAVEVPVFINVSNSTIPWLKNLKSNNGYITGHIDILQYRNNKVYILDYKPKADKEKPLGQLFIYACCLSKATGIPFSKIELAWFDENIYYETGAMKVYKYLMQNYK
ncbi:MAG: hypothetical protein PHW82_01220 [Bacteroidales bacterium]|nr:hypothetical protein [Bacteroidales bacterium]